MKNIHFLILTVLLTVSIGANIYQFHIIKDNRVSFNNKEDEILKLKENHHKGILDLENKIKEKDNEIEIRKEYEKKNWHPIEIDVQVCMKKRNYTTAGMSECTLESEDSWNKEIEKSLSEIKRLTDSKTKVFLDNSQKDWEKYRESQRKVIYNTVYKLQGTMYINISHSLDVYITKQRAQDLDYILYLIKNGNYIE